MWLLPSAVVAAAVGWVSTAAGWEVVSAGAVWAAAFGEGRSAAGFGEALLVAVFVVLRSLEVADHIIMQEDFDRLHKFLETDNLPEISSDLRKVIEEEWPELVYKLPPKE